LGLLALGALVVALALTFGGLPRQAKPASQAFQSPIQTPTQPPYPPPETPTPPGPPATPTVPPTPIPRCTFAARPAPAEPAPPLEAYQFSEPRVVLTHTSAIGIAGWLPDGQRLLVTRLIPGQSREYVEVFNTRTGELQRYGERHSLPGKPVWLAAHQAVAFADVAPDKQVVLRISWGEGAAVETPVSGLAASFLGASPDGRQVVFFTQAAPNRPEALDIAQAQRVTLPVTLPPTPYRISWHPQGDQIAFYNETGFYLADLPSGRICEVDLGFEESEARYGKRWAFYAQWSPNGRYLAMLTTVGNLPVKFSDLTILDTTAGELHSIHPDQYINPGQYYVTDMAWAPNSQLIAIRAAVEMREGVMYEGLYLVEVASGRDIRMLPEALFTGGDAGWNLAWSRNGQQMAANCPTANEGRLCMIAVTTR